jgi:two-component system chemotaxis sensor kinase CheA
VLAVEEVWAEREVAVRGLGKRLRGLGLYGGAALLPEGELVPLLNPTEISRRIRRGEGSLTAPAEAPRAGTERRRVLLVEDSPTTRMLVQNILESAGYAVLPCSDGEEAWRALEAEAVDAVVSDVEMPRLDGFALTERIRASPRFARLPIVLVTAREKEEDRRRGLEAGASAYVVKSAFEQSVLLEALERLL